jgi:hypothetical protein
MIDCNRVEPEDDPELAQYAVEFAQKAMTRRPDIFLAIQPASLLEYLFMFSIRLLNGSEPLPKYAAAEFWVSQSHQKCPNLDVVNTRHSRTS